MIKLTLASLWARKRRISSICVAVGLSVAFLTGTLVLGDTLNRNFDRLFTNASAGTAVVVRSSTAVAPGNPRDQGRALIDESLLALIRTVPGVAHAEAQVVGYGSLLGHNQQAIGGNGPPRQAGSWVTAPALNPYRLVQGHAPRAADEVVINRGAAKSGNLHVGDTTIVQTPGPVTVKIVGIATFGTADGLGQTTFTAFTLAGAEASVTHQAGKISAILVRASPGTSSDTLRAQIAARLPAGVQAITGSQLANERITNVDATFLSWLRTVLVIFALIALVMAALTINNTFSIVLAQRTGELALLRAVGASRRQLRRSVFLEALLIAAAAAGLGVAAGLGLAGLLKGVFDSAGFALPAGGLDVQVPSLIIAAGAGVIVTLVVAQLPARRAAAIPPVAALRQAGTEARQLSRRRITIGAVLTAAGVVVALSATVSSGIPALAGPGSLLLVIGVMMLAPIALPPTAGAMGGVLRRVRGAAGFLAQENARRNPRRSASAATALVVGVAVVALITVMASSVKATLDHDTRAPFRADLAVNTSSFGGSQLSPRIVSDLSTLPQIGQAVALGQGPALLNGKTTTITSADPGTVQQVVAIHTLSGSLHDLGSQGIAISRTEAAGNHWSLATAVPVTFPDGARQRLTVAAVYDTNTLLGDVLVPAALWAQHTAQPSERAVFLTIRPGVSPADARHAVEPIAKRYGGDVQDQAQYAAAATSGLKLLLGLVYVLLALAIVIALLGIANTLSLAVYERRREIALLRAVGETRRQARSALRLEAVILATFGNLLGLILGGFLGWSTFEATAAQGATFSLPVSQLVVIAFIGAAAGILAAWRPARRASQTPILQAIATT